MDGRNDYMLAALRRAATTLRADALELAGTLDAVASLLDSAQAGMEVSGSLAAARTLASAYWSLTHASQSLPWLDTEVRLLLTMLPRVASRDDGSLPHGHPWEEYQRPSPLRLDEDLFDATFGS